MVHIDTAFGNELFGIRITELLSKIPPNSRKNDALLENADLKISYRNLTFVIGSGEFATEPFFLVAALLQYLGEPVREKSERCFNELALIFLHPIRLLGGGMLALKWLFESISRETKPEEKAWSVGGIFPIPLFPKKKIP